jgi:hypothetical protein
MSDPFHQQIVPIPQPEAGDVLTAYRVTYEFYEEVRFRAAFEQHCQWYQQVAEQHRQELDEMRKDINLFGWFNGRRKAG